MINYYGDTRCINCGWRNEPKAKTSHLFTIKSKQTESFLDLKLRADRIKAERYLSRCIGSGRKGKLISEMMGKCSVCDGDIPVDFDGFLVKHRPTEWWTQKLKQALEQSK
tara:strand:+ start:1176 stop:1505 length:330 start_codon:yes stop_codon:yes gene_type:complete